MLRFWVLAGALLLGACGELEPDPELLCDGPPGAAEAVEIARIAVGIPRTTVWWYGPKALPDECGHDSFLWDGRCVSGITGANGSVVAWEGTWRPSETALGHEMVHQRYGDPYHSRVDLWGSEGDKDFGFYVPGSFVAGVYAAIIATGL